MHQTPLLCFFYLNCPSPPGVFLYPSSGITPPPLHFYVNCPYPPDYVLSIPHRFLSRLFPGSSLLYQSPAYPPTLLRQLTPPPILFLLHPLNQIFPSPPLPPVFSLLYPRKLVFCVVLLVCI